MFFLHNMFSPKTLDPKKCRALRLKSSPYQLIDNVLFRKNYDGIFLRCLEKDQINEFLFQIHARPTGGNFLGETMSHKIIRAGYYWPTLFRDSHAYVKRCEPCQKCTRKVKKPAFPLHPIAVQFPFQQWDWISLDLSTLYPLYNTNTF